MHSPSLTFVLALALIFRSHDTAGHRCRQPTCTPFTAAIASDALTAPASIVPIIARHTLTVSQLPTLTPSGTPTPSSNPPLTTTPTTPTPAQVAYFTPHFALSTSHTLILSHLHPHLFY